MKSVGHRMNDDRVNSLTSEIVYLEHQKVFLRTKGKEGRTKLFKLLVSVVTAESSASDKNIVRNGNIKIGNLSFEEVEKLKYLGATVTNINDTREEIKHRINMGNACYYSVVKLLSSSLLSKNLKVRIYKTVILLVVLYGCETWTLTLREEHSLRVFENNVLRKIFGAKRDEVTGEWRKLHNTELHALYSSLDIIRNIKSRRLRWAGHVVHMGESRNAYRVLVGKPEGKRPLGRPRRRWEDIKMDLREVGYDREWINLAQDRDQWRAYVRAAMNLRSLSIEVTDDNDPFVLYSLLVSESDFQVIKEQQGLLIEYDKFSFQLSKLLHLCKSNSDDGGNYRLVIEETGEETFGNKKTVMKIVETNQFKQLCHLILEIGVGTDNEIKKHMADQLKTLKEALHNAEKKISEQEIRAENTARKLEQKEQEIEKLREEWREDSNAVSEKAKEQINTERENAIRVQQDMREAFENEKKQLQTIILETKKSFELLVEELQTEKKLLIEQNCQTDSRLRDLNNTIDSLYKENCSLQQEVTMLLSQNSKLDAGYHEKEKNLNLTKKKYAMLEQNLLEENIVKKNSEIARLNNSLQTLTEENTNANDIITSFQNEFPVLKAKIKLRTKIILEQESILAQRDSDKTALEKETEELKNKVDDLKATQKELSELLQTTKEKLNQKEEALTSNKH
ncbi:hypothetical protein ANN_26416, partial [Periplaneta americana]